MSPGHSLRDQTAATLRHRIVSVALKPGQRLVERDLATELEVSRIPVREALRALAAEGLVVQVPGKGTLVAPFSPDDVRDLFDVREALESLAARLAAQRATPATIAPLDAALHAEAEATATGDAELISRSNVVFHAQVVALAGNPLLTSTTRLLSARVEWLLRLTFNPDDRTHGPEHEALFDLIAHGEADRAATFAWDHIEADRTTCTEMARRWFVDSFDPNKVASTRRRRKNTTKGTTPGDDPDTEPPPDDDTGT